MVISACSTIMSGRSRRKKLVRSKRLKESVCADLEQEADVFVDPRQPPRTDEEFENEFLVNCETHQPLERDRF